MADPRVPPLRLERVRALSALSSGGPISVPSEHLSRLRSVTEDSLAFTYSSAEISFIISPHSPHHTIRSELSANSLTQAFAPPFAGRLTHSCSLPQTSSELARPCTHTSTHCVGVCVAHTQSAQSTRSDVLKRHSRPSHLLSEQYHLVDPTLALSYRRVSHRRRFKYLTSSSSSPCISSRVQTADTQTRTEPDDRDFDLHPDTSSNQNQDQSQDQGEDQAWKQKVFEGQGGEEELGGGRKGIELIGAARSQTAKVCQSYGLEPQERSLRPLATPAAAHVILVDGEAKERAETRTPFSIAKSAAPNAGAEMARRVKAESESLKEHSERGRSLPVLDPVPPPALIPVAPISVAPVLVGDASIGLQKKIAEKAVERERVVMASSRSAGGAWRRRRRKRMLRRTTKKEEKTRGFSLNSRSLRSRSLGSGMGLRLLSRSLGRGQLSSATSRKASPTRSKVLRKKAVQRHRPPPRSNALFQPQNQSQSQAGNHTQAQCQTFLSPDGFSRSSFLNGARESPVRKKRRRIMRRISASKAKPLEKVDGTFVNDGNHLLTEISSSSDESSDRRNTADGGPITGDGTAIGLGIGIETGVVQGKLRVPSTKSAGERRKREGRGGDPFGGYFSPLAPPPPSFACSLSDYNYSLGQTSLSGNTFLSENTQALLIEPHGKADRDLDAFNSSRDSRASSQSLASCDTKPSDPFPGLSSKRNRVGAGVGDPLGEGERFARHVDGTVDGRAGGNRGGCGRGTGHRSSRPWRQILAGFLVRSRRLKRGLLSAPFRLIRQRPRPPDNERGQDGDVQQDENASGCFVFFRNYISNIKKSFRTHRR